MPDYVILRIRMFSTNSSISRLECIFIYLFIHSFIHLFIYVFIYLLIYLFVCLFIIIIFFIICTRYIYIDYMKKKELKSGNAEPHAR